MKFLCLSVVVVLFTINSVANGADLEMFVNSTTRVQVEKDLSNTYGLKFCLRSDRGIVLSLAPTYGVWDQQKRYTFEIGNKNDWTCIRPTAVANVGARSYETGLVNFDQEQCFWSIWADNWYFVGKGSVWGEHLLINYRNQSQSPLAGLWVNTLSGQAYLRILDETISKADALSKAALSLYVPPTYAGPSGSEPTTVSVTTTSGAAYQTLPIDLTGVTDLSMSITPHNTSYGAYVALYDNNNPDPLNGYELNPYRYQFSFNFGKGIGKQLISNSNNYNYATYPFGTFKQFWMSWKNGKIAFGMGETTGDQTVIAWDDPSPLTVNSIKILSKDINIDWKIPRRFYP
jgi:hypothetical protein